MKVIGPVKAFGLTSILGVLVLNASQLASTGEIGERAGQKVPAADDESEAIEEIKKAGGIIERYGDALLFSFKNPSKSTNASLAGVMPALQRLKHLKRVKLLDTQLDDAGIATLKNLKGIEYLSVTRTKLTDAAVSDLARLSELRTLWMGRTRVTDEGLAPLKALSKLEFLYLGETKVSDAGIDHLLAIPNLKYLYLGDTRVSPAGLEKLKSSRPELTVVML